MANKAPKPKHTPVRTCIATGEKLPKDELMRFVRISSGAVVVDPQGRERGRGANLTMSLEAFDLAVKKHAFKRALKLDRDLTSEQLTQLREDFAQAIELKSFRRGREKVVLKVDKKQLDAILT